MEAGVKNTKRLEHAHNDYLTEEWWVHDERLAREEIDLARSERGPITIDDFSSPEHLELTV